MSANRSQPAGSPTLGRPGRKRSEDSRQAILAATAEIVAESGYRTLSIERIAQRSGTGKQTIYRWWPSKADVVMEALATKADLHIPVPDTGNLADDLRAVLRSTFTMARAPQVADLLRGLMTEAQLDATFADRFRSDFLQRRRRVLGVILKRGADRRELRSGVSVRTATDIVFGTMWYRILAVPGPLNNVLAGELAQLLAVTSKPAGGRAP